ELAAQNPGKKPPTEEEDPVRPPKPKTPLRVEEEDPNAKPPKPLDKAGGPRPTDLAVEAEQSYPAEIKLLFRRLAVPHDVVTMKSGRMYRIEPIPQYIGPEPKFKEKIKLQPFGEKWERRPAFEVVRTDIQGVEHYEQFAVSQVNKLLDPPRSKERAPDPKKALEMLQAAEKALSFVVRFHESARERKLRSGNEWNEVEKQLRNKLREVQLGQVGKLADAKDWEGAFTLAVQLADAYPADQEVQGAVARLFARQASEAIRAEDYSAARM